MNRTAYPEIDLRDVRPTIPRTLFMLPFLGSGFTPSGIYVAYSDRLYPVLGRVLRTYECLDVSEGDVVHFRPMAYDWVHLDDGRSFCVMNERAVDAILEGFDSTSVTIELAKEPAHA